MLCLTAAAAFIRCGLAGGAGPFPFEPREIVLQVSRRAVVLISASPPLIDLNNAGVKGDFPQVVAPESRPREQFPVGRKRSDVADPPSRSPWPLAGGLVPRCRT